MPKTEELIGVFSWLQQHFTDSNTIIGKLQSNQVVKGSLGEGESLERGSTYRFFGRWTEHPKYGKQFAFTSYVQDCPHNEAGVIKYLQDNAPGVGAVTAKKMWDKYGPKAADMLADNPKQLIKDKIFRADDIKEASAALQLLSATRKTTIDLLSLFAGRGFPGRLVRECIARWGVTAPKQIKDKPYTLMTDKLPGCGFKRVDRLYLDLKFPPDAIERQMFAGWYALRSDQSGHTWHPIQKIHDAIRDTVGSTRNLNPALAIEQGVKDKWLALWKNTTPSSPKGWVAERQKADDERTVMEEIKRLLGTTDSIWGRSPAIHLEGSQLAEALKAISLPVGVLSGHAGTGKTFSAAAIVKYACDTVGSSFVAVCCPTGKAAVRCNAAMQKYNLPVKATTIHRALGVGSLEDGAMQFKYNRILQLPFRLIVIDEASMVDVSLLAHLFVACQNGTHVLLIGDSFQLPPVGHGAPLRDIMDFLSSVGRLTEIWRNSGMIVTACSAIKDGKPFTTAEKFNLETGDNLRHVETRNASSSLHSLETVLQKLAVSKKYDVFEDVQILCAVNEKSELARSSINLRLQALLNPSGKRAGTNPFRVDDKIICLKNSQASVVLPENCPDPSLIDSFLASGEILPDEPESYFAPTDANDKPAKEFVANGDVGRVVAVGPLVTIAKFTNPTRIIRIPQFNRKPEEEDPNNPSNDSGKDYDLAYAITCHKSQGSEWPIVIVLIDDYAGARFVCSREWVYTALSRASQMCLVIGKMATLNGFCRRVSLRDRKTHLVELLKG